MTLAEGAHLAELGLRWRRIRRCTASPRRAGMNAQGCELPAEGAHRAASRRDSTSVGEASRESSKVVGLPLSQEGMQPRMPGSPRAPLVRHSAPGRPAHGR